MQTLSPSQIRIVAGGAMPRPTTPTSPYADLPAPVGPLRDPTGLDV